MRIAIKYTALIFLLTLSAGAQVAVPIPAGTVVVPAATATTPGVVRPDGTSCSVTAGILSCVPVFVFPPNMTFDGTTLKVPRLSATELDLTGGATYADGDYLATFKSGAITWKSYIPPTSGGGTTPAGKTYTLAVPQLAGWAQTWYLVPNAVVAAGQTAWANPVFSGAPSASMLYLANPAVWVNSAGQVYVRIGNGTGATIPAMTWNVVVK